MYSLDQILLDLKQHLQKEFKTVRISSVQLQEHLLAEMQAIHPDRLPAVIICHQQSGFAAENSIREHDFTMVLVDRFVAGEEDRALSLYAAYEQLLNFFDPAGMTVNDVFYCPGDCYACTADKNWTCLALSIKASQTVL